MKILTIKNLKSTFVGKICTILAKPIAKSNLSDHQFADFFTGVIDDIDDDGIFTTHALTGCKNFYKMSDIVGIIEEQVLDENDPKHQKIISELKQSKEKANKEDTNEEKFIDIDDLSELTEGINDEEK